MNESKNCLGHVARLVHREEIGGGIARGAALAIKDRALQARGVSGMAKAVHEAHGVQHN